MHASIYIIMKFVIEISNTGELFPRISAYLMIVHETLGLSLKVRGGELKSGRRS